MVALGVHTHTSGVQPSSKSGSTDVVVFFSLIFKSPGYLPRLTLWLYMDEGFLRYVPSGGPCFKVGGPRIPGERLSRNTYGTVWLQLLTLLLDICTTHGQLLPMMTVYTSGAARLMVSSK